MFQKEMLEQIKTHFMFSNPPPPRKYWRLCDNLGKCGTAKLKLYWNIMGGGGSGNIVFKVLSYKLEGRWFDPSSCHWDVSFT